MLRFGNWTTCARLKKTADKKTQGQGPTYECSVIEEEEDLEKVNRDAFTAATDTIR